MKYFYLLISIVNICLLAIEEYYFVMYNFFFLLPIYFITWVTTLTIREKIVKADGRPILNTFIFNLLFFIAVNLWYQFFVN